MKNPISLWGLTILLVILCIMLVMITTPASATEGQDPPPRTLRWSFYPDGCWQTEEGDFYYVFVVQLFGGNKQGEWFHWESGPDSGAVRLYWNKGPSSAVITTVDRTMEVKVRQHRRTEYNDAECAGPVGENPPGAIVRPLAEPQLLMVTLQDNPGSVRWSCGGGPYEHVTVVDQMDMYNEQVGAYVPTFYSVLPLDQLWQPDASYCVIDHPDSHWYTAGRDLVACLLYTGNLWYPECEAIAAEEGRVDLH